MPAPVVEIKSENHRKGKKATYYIGRWVAMAFVTLTAALVLGLMAWAVVEVWGRVLS